MRLLFLKFIQIIHIDFNSRLHPEYDQAMNNLANILKERGDLGEAERLLVEATTIRWMFCTVVWPE